MSSSVSSRQAKEEARLKAVERLQQKYAIDAAEKAEKMKKLEEAKRIARLEELIRLDEKGGHVLGSKTTESLRPASVSSLQAKEEARLKAVERLQQKYAIEAAEKAEKMKKLEEAKRMARLEELKRLDEKGGHVLGSK